MAAGAGKSPRCCVVDRDGAGPTTFPRGRRMNDRIDAAAACVVPLRGDTSAEGRWFCLWEGAAGRAVEQTRLGQGSRGNSSRTLWAVGEPRELSANAATLLRTICPVGQVERIRNQLVGDS